MELDATSALDRLSVLCLCRAYTVHVKEYASPSVSEKIANLSDAE